MTSDTSKSDIKVLIAKIEKMQDLIEKQSKISSLDIDLQLDYIRNLYDAYLELKFHSANETCNLAVYSEEDTDSSTTSDSRTLSLFGKFEGNLSDMKSDIPSYNPIEKDIPEQTEFFEEEKTREIEGIGEEQIPVETELLEEKEWEENATEIEIEEELPEVEMDAGMGFSVDNELIASRERGNNEDKNAVVRDINLDDIEFDDEDEEVEVVKKNTIGIPHSRYYGDEIEIENPIPVKPATIGERYKTEKPSLNEIVSSYKPDESIASKIHQSGISDLMKSIDMNHKFMFVKELFKGNGSVFTEEINNLNNFNKLNEAIPYLESIKAKYKWDGQSEAYAELYRLVLRKFAK